VLCVELVKGKGAIDVERRNSAHRPLSLYMSTKLYCLMSEVYVSERLVHRCYVIEVWLGVGTHNLLILSMSL